MRLKRKIYIPIIVVAGIILLLTIAALITWNLINISYDTEEKIDSIEQNIIITRDANGIPRINISSINDMYFALGYLHAKDRLDLIEYYRALAIGNSEMFVKSDSVFLNNIARTIGFSRKAKEITEALTPEQQTYIERYCAGINHIRKSRPSSYFLPADWTVQDVVAILVMKEWANSYLNNIELVINLSDSKKTLSGKLLPGKMYTRYYSEEDAINLQTLRHIKELVEKYIGTFNRGFSIYIDSSLDISGSNYFTSFAYEDSYSTYPGWYPVRILINNFPIDSITYSGLPFLFVFKNSDTTMIHFSINADTQQFITAYTEEHEGKMQYRINGAWHEFQTIRVPVKSSDGTESNEVIWLTDKGPCINEIFPDSSTNGSILIVNSVLCGAGYVQLLLDSPFALKPDVLKKYITAVDAPAKCFLVSTVNETFKAYSGYIFSDSGDNVFKNGSTFIQQGFTKLLWFKSGLSVDYAGSDVIPQNELTFYRNSILTNDLKTERLDQLLVPKKIYSERKVIEIISDNNSVAAQKFTPVFRAILESNPLTSAKLTKIYFSDWDYNTSYGTQAPAIFYTTLYYFIRETLKDEFGPDLDYNMNSSYLMYNDFYSMMIQNQQLIYDNPDTESIENREMIFDISFFNSMRSLNRKNGPIMDDWTWNKTNNARFNPPKMKYNILSNIYEIKNSPVSGGPDTLSCVVFNNNFVPVSGRSISGIMNNNEFKISMNTGYSTTLLSDFYFAKTGKIRLTDIGSVNSIHKMVITK